MWIKQNWITAILERRREERRVRALANIRSTAAYYKVDLSLYSDKLIERAVFTRFRSLDDCSNMLDMFNNIDTKAKLALYWLKGAYNKEDEKN